jgi:DNA-binding response OmpR family regulator
MLETLSDLDWAAHSPTLLIVEDEPLIGVALSEYLQECGFEVLVATNATDAIGIILKSGTRLDLIFSDVVMPGPINGFGLAQWVRRNRPALPLVLTSGAKIAANELGENERFVRKPYRLDAVVSQFRALIDSRRNLMITA